MTTPHPAVAAHRQYDWHYGQAAAMDRALSELVSAPVPSHVVESQRAARDDQVAKLDAAHAEVKRCLLGL